MDQDQQQNENVTPAEPTVDTAPAAPEAPADALSRTPDELKQEAAQTAEAPSAEAIKLEAKRSSPLRRLWRAINVYLLLFILLLVVAAAIAAVNYFNSQKAAPAASIVNQKLSEDALKQLANTDTSVSSPSQTLTIQGNAIIDGQTLARGNLNVAGNLQTGGSLQAPSLTISGQVNLGATQANSLQIAQNLAVQGTTTLRNLNVSGTSTFKGAMTASQITASSLILSGNATVSIPGHITYTGTNPGRTINSSVLGNGGSASVDGSDTTGTININSGGNPTAGCFINLIFVQRYNTRPHVIITPVDKAAGQLQYYVTRDNNGFSICSANAAVAHQSFAFDYFVAG
jgi:cytoskeletal protein CcmA (bactofilin family)